MVEGIGFIGLGKMGTPILGNIMKKYDVKGVYNRTRTKSEPFGELGLRIYDSPGLLAANCNIVFTMLTDSEAVESVIFGPTGIYGYINSGSLVVDLSTIHPEKSREIAGRLAEKGVYFIDAPVIGSVQVAEKGELTIVAGGPKEVFERIRGVIETFGSNIFYMGENGSGLRMKLVNNMVMGANLAVISEALTFGQNLGIDPENLIEVLASGAAGSNILDLKKESLLGGDFLPQFLLAHEYKDLNYAMDVARRARSPVPIGSLSTQFYAAAMAIGLGNLDFSAVLRSFRALNGKA